MFAYDRGCHIILLILTINIFGRLPYLLNKHRNWSMEKSNLPKATPTDLAKPESETVSRSVVSDLCHPTDCCPPGSSVHGFSRQEYRSGLPFPSPGESFWPRDWTQVSYTASRFLTFWGPRQHIKKQRQHFADTGPWSQSYGFSSSHLWVWELGHKEGWALKNWSFQTVVLEKTLESLLDSKEIQPVHPKGNQPWIFIRRTDAEAETPVPWPPDAKSWLTGKDSDAGKDYRQKEKGAAEDEMVR